MWPDTPMAIDVARPFNSDWCGQIPSAALVLERYCGIAHVLDDRRRHRRRLDKMHDDPHACWCDRRFDRRADPLVQRG
jgi:hypothetical protein